MQEAAEESMTASDTNSKKSSRLESMMQEYLKDNAVMNLDEQKMFSGTGIIEIMESTLEKDGFKERNCDI